MNLQEQGIYNRLIVDIYIGYFQKLEEINCSRDSLKIFFYFLNNNISQHEKAITPVKK